MPALSLARRNIRALFQPEFCRIYGTQPFCVERDGMMKETESSFRKGFLLLATSVAALGVSLGLPMKKTLAASPDWKTAQAPTVNQPTARLTVIQPARVDSSTVRLLKIADQALSDNALAERIFRQPDAVASQYHLSKNERLVLRRMTREQFQTARNDATRVVATRLASAGSTRLPAGATDVHLITERMIVGRAILAAVGRSYLDAANAHDCCPWSKSIELGISSDPAFYNVVFKRPSGVNLPQSGAKVLQPGVNLPQSGTKILQPGAKLSQ
jgi:hypothetical protein